MTCKGLTPYDCFELRARRTTGSSGVVPESTSSSVVGVLQWSVSWQSQLVKVCELVEAHTHMHTHTQTVVIYCIHTW